jgi:uncharacterized protein YceK
MLSIKDHARPWQSQSLGLIIVVALGGFPWLSGCSTIATKKDPLESCTDGRPRTSPAFIYSGTRCDVRLLSNTFDGSLLGIFGPFGLIDLPLSFAADTLILPWTIYQHTHRDHWSPPLDAPNSVGI